MLKFKVGDRVRTTEDFWPTRFANREARIEKVDVLDDACPYLLDFRDGTCWAIPNEVVSFVRTPDVIRAEIAALESELAGVQFKVGDRVRLEATVTAVADGTVCIKADNHAGQIWYAESVLTKVPQ